MVYEHLVGTQVIKYGYQRTRKEIDDFTLNLRLKALGLYDCDRWDVDGTQVIVGLRGDPAQVCVFVEGTNEVEDWLKNINFTCYKEDGVRFTEGFKRFSDPIVDRYKRLLSHDFSGLYLHGHSLGGGALYYLAQNARTRANFQQPIHWVTYGAPRGLKGNMRQIWAKNCQLASCTQYTNAGDPVPLFPLALPVPFRRFGFEHTESLKRFTRNGQLVYLSKRDIAFGIIKKTLRAIFRRPLCSVIEENHAIESYERSLSLLDVT